MLKCCWKYIFFFFRKVTHPESKAGEIKAWRINSGPRAADPRPLLGTKRRDKQKAKKKKDKSSDIESQLENAHSSKQDDNNSRDRGEVKQ